MDADHMTPMDSVHAGIHIIPTDIKDSALGCEISCGTVRAILTKFYANVLIQVLSVFLCGRGLAMKQTSIVIIKDSVHIVAAADSRVMLKPSNTICKIHQSGNIFWAMAGLIDDSATGYDIRSIAERAVREGKTIDGALEHFTELVPQILKKEPAQARKMYPGIYAEHHQEFGLEGVFFGIQDSKPFSALGTSPMINPMARSIFPRPKSGKGRLAR